MTQEQSISEFLEFARRQMEILAAQLRKESSKFQEYLDWEATVRSIEWGTASGGSSPPAFRSSPSAEIYEACVAVMEQHSGPVATRDLLHELESRGIRISGSQPVRNLSSKLSSSPRFLSLGPQGWVLADWEVEGNDEK